MEYIVINALILFTNLILVILNIRKMPRWEHYKEGIRFFNKDKQVTIETDKPLKK